VFDGRDPGVPVVARLVGTNAEHAMEILAGHRLATAETMDEAVEKAVELAGRAG
jgi:succinyl-CoA synthetase beta subunit